MSFDNNKTPEIPDNYDYGGDSISSAEQGLASSEYYVTDVLPTEVSNRLVDYVEADDSAVPLPTPEELPDTWKTKCVSYIGATIVEGEHPNEQVRQFIDAAKEQIVVEYAAFRETIADLPDRNSEFAAQIIGCRQILSADFVDVVGGAPIKLLSSEDYARVAITDNVAQERGTVRFGHILIHAYDELIEKFGRNSVVHNVLHEGAHLSGGSPNDLIITAQPCRPGEQQIKDPQNAPCYRINTASGHFKKPFELDRPPYGMSIGGHFIEEGFAEEYATRRRELIVGSAHVPPSVRIYNEGVGPLGFTDGTERLPRYNPSESRLYLPWRYVPHVKYDIDAGRLLYATGNRCLAAYALHLMDAQVPGLFDDMMRSRSEPLHYAVVERRIDALAPGLYAALAQTEDEGGDFRRSLLKVERALGVVHRPVEPV